MPLTIDEVTADVDTPPERREAEPPRAVSLLPSELRRQREQSEKAEQRTRRVRAD